ncbi:MAG: hypothetical protein A2W99_14565 [Bacteroidetes bacterium GWF2_33_16]|nr:MAG: hypothetical protein A2X00_08775 [Bacteroidetes bacterium GWE2_32_14]OFY04896.1 MAG: hypothetical protein A2W99_14565 [Bacteroidetes bacterium GWF2_33_16]
MFYVYILFSEKLSKFYIGQTNNLEERLKRHNSGYEIFTSKGTPWKLLWKADKATRTEAMDLEKKLKNLSQKRLQQFMQKYNHEVAGPDEASLSGC